MRRDTFLNNRNMVSDYHSERGVQEQHVSYSAPIFTVIFGVLFVVMYFQVVVGIGSGLSFTGFLRVLSDAPSIDISWINKVSTVSLGDWGVFDWLKSFVQFFLNILSVMLYFSVGIAQIVVYVGYIMGFLFGVA